jgi:hypothetical protein
VKEKSEKKAIEEKGNSIESPNGNKDSNQEKTSTINRWLRRMIAPTAASRFRMCGPGEKGKKKSEKKAS